MLSMIILPLKLHFIVIWVLNLIACNVWFDIYSFLPGLWRLLLALICSLCFDASFATSLLLLCFSYARTSNFMAEKKEGHNRHSTHSVASDGCNMQRQHLSQSKLIRSSENKKLPQRILLKSAHSKESVSLQSSKECSRQRECPLSVLAYPFALVKPIGIHGDITLQDINQRINSSPCRTSQAYSEQPKSISSSPYSGKSVLALTKIYTEGNGTITIMRTKG
ncbi:hypothetical protein KP509_39G003700 [Ceratopteris richardii]|uniref:Protein XRI1 n=1 Tax=Ceratopteris richardii TaxID=49495 RepID=A0A8T2PY57_CERRI|nr:hypothetical protein KP509_39G003700 [Ceratopteris richardii]